MDSHAVFLRKFAKIDGEPNIISTNEGGAHIFWRWVHLSMHVAGTVLNRGGPLNMAEINLAVMVQSKYCANGRVGGQGTE